MERDLFGLGFLPGPGEGGVVRTLRTLSREKERGERREGRQGDGT